MIINTNTISFVYRPWTCWCSRLRVSSVCNKLSDKLYLHLLSWSFIDTDLARLGLLVHDRSGSIDSLHKFLDLRSDLQTSDITLVAPLVTIARLGLSKPERNLDEGFNSLLVFIVLVQFSRKTFITECRGWQFVCMSEDYKLLNLIWILGSSWAPSLFYTRQVKWLAKITITKHNTNLTVPILTRTLSSSSRTPHSSPPAVCWGRSTPASWTRPASSWGWAASWRWCAGRGRGGPPSCRDSWSVWWWRTRFSSPPCCPAQGRHSGPCSWRPAGQWRSNEMS